MKLRKFAMLVLIVAVAVSVIACFAACDDSEEAPEPSADLVAVRVNGYMAEWKDINYNFGYEGSSDLTVDVPYTNYLRIDDLIVSPGAEYTVFYQGGGGVYTFLDKIPVNDKEAKFIIKVTNGELSNSYTLTVNVKQTNLPPESEIEDRNYDNREGHVYIPDDAETVEVDGVVYEVCRGNDVELLFGNENIILTEDIYVSWAEDYLPETYSGIFNGNNYALRISGSSTLVTTLEEDGVIQNAFFYMQGRLQPMREFSNVVCENNYGTIKNVKMNVHFHDYARDPFSDIYAPLNYGYFAYRNYGKIENCLNVGDLTSQRNNGRIHMASFVTEQYGEMTNCVNTGKVQYEYDYMDNAGAGAIAYLVGEDAVFNGVYNLGECTITLFTEEQIDEKLDMLFYTTAEAGAYPDMSKIKNYT